MRNANNPKILHFFNQKGDKYSCILQQIKCTSDSKLNHDFCIGCLRLLLFHAAKSIWCSKIILIIYIIKILFLLFIFQILAIWVISADVLLYTCVLVLARASHWKNNENCKRTTIMHSYYNLTMQSTEKKNYIFKFRMESFLSCLYYSTKSSGLLN